MPKIAPPIDQDFQASFIRQSDPKMLRKLRFATPDRSAPLLRFDPVYPTRSPVKLATIATSFIMKILRYTFGKYLTNQCVCFMEGLFWVIDNHGRLDRKLIVELWKSASIKNNRKLFFCAIRGPLDMPRYYRRGYISPPSLWPFFRPYFNAAWRLIFRILGNYNETVRCSRAGGEAEKQPQRRRIHANEELMSSGIIRLSPLLLYTTRKYRRRRCER